MDLLTATISNRYLDSFEETLAEFPRYPNFVSLSNPGRQFVEDELVFTHRSASFLHFLLQLEHQSTETASILSSPVETESPAPFRLLFICELSILGADDKFGDDEMSAVIIEKIVHNFSFVLQSQLGCSKYWQS